MSPIFLSYTGVSEAKMDYNENNCARVVDRGWYTSIAVSMS